MDNQDVKELKMNGSIEENGNVKENGHNKGNEDKKIFVGGIAYDVTNEDLSQHFGQFGEVANAQVKFDRITQRSRGFAFVEFTTGEACKTALASREQIIKGKNPTAVTIISRELREMGTPTVRDSSSRSSSSNSTR